MREVRVVAAAILDAQGRLLVAQRPVGKSQAGLWELPGGKVEPGETDIPALVREIREELGATVQVHEVLDESLHPYPSQDIVVRLVAYRCTLDLQTSALCAQEHQALRWLPLGAPLAEAVDWCPADVPLLPAVQEAMRCRTAMSG